MLKSKTILNVFLQEKIYIVLQKFLTDGFWPIKEILAPVMTILPKCNLFVSDN